MVNINDPRLYDIDYLVTTWEHGWKELAELGNKLGIEPNRSESGYPGACVSTRILEGFESINYMSPESVWPYDLGPINLLELAAIPKRKRYSEKACREYMPKAKDDGGSAEEDARLRRLLKEVMTILRESKTLGEAFDKIGTRQNREKLFRQRLDELKHISGDIITESENDVRDGLQFKLEKSCYNVLDWLIEGLKNERAFEEAFWNCVWLAAEPRVNEMQEIKRRIRMDVPLTNDQLDFLNHYVLLCYPHINRIGGDDDPETYQIILETSADNQTYTKFHGAASILLTYPAYVLAQELHHGDGEPEAENFPEKMNDAWITVTKAASLAVVNPGTISRWAEKGEIKCNGKKGRERRVLKSSVLLKKAKREDEDRRKDTDDVLEDMANKIPDMH